MTVLSQLEKKTICLSNGSAASTISAEVFNLEQKTNFFIFYIKISEKYVFVLANIDFWKNWRPFEEKSSFFSLKNREWYLLTRTIFNISKKSWVIL